MCPICSASFIDWEILKGHIHGLHVGQWIIDQGWDNNKHCKFCGKTCIDKSHLKLQLSLVSHCLGRLVSHCLGTLVSHCLGRLVSHCLGRLVSHCLGCHSVTQSLSHPVTQSPSQRVTQSLSQRLVTHCLG